MKLIKTKLLETIRRKNQCWTTYQARKIGRVSIRRVNQVWKHYLLTGCVPELGKNVGRPSRCITTDEVRMVKQSYGKYRVSASTLEKLIERDYGVHLPHNHIHEIMLALDLAKLKGKKDKRKKNWIRYE